MQMLLICVPTPPEQVSWSQICPLLRLLAICKVSTEGINFMKFLIHLIYPGTTNDLLRPILEVSGFKSGTDFFSLTSPEREDPGNPKFKTATIPKVVGGYCQTTALAAALYNEIVSKVVIVSSTATAEAVKLTENIFRSVNIALVNELKIVQKIRRGCLGSN